VLIEYRLISKKGEGTFSEVLKAQSIKTGKYVAIKCMKQHYENIDQVNYYSLHLIIMAMHIGQRPERNIGT
jgi:serine/threonine protein kinase